VSLIESLRELRERSAEVPLHRLGARILLWKAYRMASARPVVPLHGRSRMRLQARPGEHGIRAGIFLLRDAYEPSVRHAIDRFVKPGDRCYDIGANLGLWTLRMAERAGPTGRVDAFEPGPETAAALAEALELSGHASAHVHTTALVESEGRATLYVPDDVGRGALAPESERDGAVSVGVRRLDDVWETQGKPAVAFVKMDVEGAEPLVLRGGSAFLAATRPVVCCEINPPKLANMGFRAGDVLEPFARLGYAALAWDAPAAALVPVAMEGDPEAVRDLVLLPDAP